MRFRVAVALVVVCIVMGVCGVLLVARGAHAHAHAVDGVAVCAEDEDSFVMCAQPYVRRMLSEADAGAAMNDLAERLDPALCHFAGHIVGVELFRRDQDVARSIEMCGRACNSACTHGIINEAFAQELGYSEAESAFLHISDEALRSGGRRLCSSAQACHGVGHVFFQVSPSLPSAMALCEDIVPRATRDYCYNGVAMEFADLLSQRSVWLAAGTAFPSIESLGSLCRLPYESQRRNCFSYLPRIVRDVHAYHGFPLGYAERATRNICESFANENDRFSCLGGIGAFVSMIAQANMSTVLDTCNRFDDADRRACIVGVATKAADDRKERLMEFCAMAGEESDRRLCYQAVFFARQNAGVTLEPVAQTCAGNDDACRAGYERAGESAWNAIRENSTVL